MKQEVHPGVLIGAVAVVVVLVLYFGFRMMQPAPYTPSPGVTADGQVPGAAGKSKSADQTAASGPGNSGTASPTPAYYPAAPPAEVPGKPVAESH